MLVTDDYRQNTTLPDALPIKLAASNKEYYCYDAEGKLKAALSKIVVALDGGLLTKEFGIDWVKNVFFHAVSGGVLVK